jgi:HK97 family phage portal protein
MAHIQSLLQNQATPRGGLKLPLGETYNDDERQRVLAMLESTFAGGANAGRGRPLLLEGGAEWMEMGLSPTDMGLIDTMHASARTIALAYGTPPQMLGIPGDNTYSNYQEARISFYEDTIIPLLTLLQREFNDWLSDDFDGRELRPNLDKVPAIADKKQRLWDMADKSMDLTIDERRALKGYEPLPNGQGDVLATTIQQGQQVNSDLKTVMDRLAYG